jgi:type I restriction modification DNA specificity domain
VVSVLSSYYEKFLATGEVKCIDEEIPFEIPQGWEWCRLGEISTYAQTKRKINASKADSKLWGLDLEDIEKGGRLLNIRTVGERKPIGDKTIFNRGDILYSKLRPYLLKILVAPEGGICTPEIIPFTCYGDICRDYIVSFLKSPYVDDYINSVTFGVKMPRVSTETMTSLLVPLPPISEQFRIDKKTKVLMPYIDGYGKTQEKLNKLNEELSDSIRKSILQEAIQGKLVSQQPEEGTAEELLTEIRKEKELLVKEGKLKKSALNDSAIFKGDDNKYWEKLGKEIHCIDDEIPFEIPASWQWVRIKDIFQINPKNVAEDNCISAFIPMEKICATYGSEFSYDEVQWKTIKTGYTHFADGDVVFAKITPCFQNRKSAIFIGLPNGIGAGTTELKVMRPYGETINRWYLLYFLKSPYFIDEAQFKGTANQQRIITGYLENKLFPLPPKFEQDRIVQQIKQLASIMSR